MTPPTIAVNSVNRIENRSIILKTCLISSESIKCQAITTREKMTTANPEILVLKYSPLCFVLFIYIPVISQSIWSLVIPGCLAIKGRNTRAKWIPISF